MAAIKRYFRSPAAVAGLILLGIVIAMALSASYTAPVHGTTSWGVFRH